MTYYLLRNTNSSNSKFLIRSHEGQKRVAHFSSGERKEPEIVNSTSGKTILHKRKIKTLSNKGKSTVFVISSATLKEKPKKVPLNKNCSGHA